MYDDDSPFTEPIAPTSRAILTLPHKPRSEESRRDSPSVDPERIKLYDQAWSICHARIQTTLASLHDQSLDQIVTFVKTLPSDSDPLALYTALTGGKVPLKTGLILGASPGSSSLVFTSLLRQLRLAPAGQSIDTRVDKPCLVSRLTSRECSNIKNALKSLIAGFVGSDVELELDDDDDDDTDLRAR
ncbi:uncharacterized protein JCM15063_002175 [Sporobolomyces koalae]|uniref:uncharacterized protein n=1 Tax=Sporobolomyces koalae TaxID=500713 RepID=UPI0031744BE1